MDFNFYYIYSNNLKHKSMKKKFIFYTITLFTFGLILHSCRVDPLDDHSHGRTLGRTSDRISLSQFRNETEVSNFKETFSISSPNILNKGGADLLSTFIIDSANINRFEMNGETTYAFSAYNIFDATDTQYKLVYFYKENKWNHSLLELKADHSSIPLYDSRVGVITTKPSVGQMCPEVYQTVDWSCKNHEPYDQCDKCGACFVVNIHSVMVDCGGSNGPGGNPGNNGPGTGNPTNGENPGAGTGTGAGTGGLNDPSPYYFDPFADPQDPFQIRSIRAKTFWNQLSYERKEWTQSAYVYLNILENYLDNYPQQSSTTLYQQNLDYHIWIIDLFMANPTLTWETFYNQFIDTPCEKINAKQSDTRYTEKFDALNQSSIFAMNRERGFFERQPPASNNLPSTYLQIDGQVGTSGLSLPTDITGIVGLLHSHNDEVSDGSSPIKIFSPTDVRTFINHFMPQANSRFGSYTKAYSTVVTSLGSYTLQFTGNMHPGGINYSTWQSWSTWYKEKYEQLIKDDNLTQANVEKVFTQFLKEKVNIAGIEVYRVTNDSAVKLEYDGKNNPVKATTCP